jgi:hypothetical protein
MLFKTIIFILLNSIFSITIFAVETSTVMSSGVGKDIESAIQNAAEAALTQVVGSFIDSNKIIEKRKEIKNGIKTQTKKVSSKVSQYSQGSIQSLDIIDVEEKEGLTYATVKVSVRIEDFEKYIKKIVSAEKKVKKGLLSKIKIKKKQSKNLSNIFIDKLSDLESFQVMSIEINGDIEEVEDVNIINGRLQGNPTFKSMSDLVSDQGTVVRIPVRSKIKSEFLKNYINTLDEIASSRFIGNKIKKWEIQKKPSSNYVVMIGEFLFGYYQDSTSPGWSKGEAEIYVNINRWKKNFTWGMGLDEMSLKKSEVSKIRLYSFNGKIASDLCKRMIDREEDPYFAKDVDMRNNISRFSTPSISLKYLDENGSVIRDEVLEPTVLLTNQYPGVGNTMSEYSFVYFKNGEYWRGFFPFAAVVRQNYMDSDRNCSTVVDIAQDYEIISLVSDELLSNTAKVEVSYLE